MAEDDRVLVCAPAGCGYFADDMTAACSECAAAIVHRPHAAHFKHKICLRCAQKHRDAGPVEIGMTPEAQREVELFFAKPQGGRS